MESNRLPSEKLLTPREVAAWLDVSVDWVQDHAAGKEPRILSVRIGKLLRFRREDVEEFIRRQAQRSVTRAFAPDLSLTAASKP
jgi:excisionase family DNA binding protein